MKKKIYVLMGMTLVGMVLSGCHKVCSCTGYDGRVHEYSAEEVDEHAGGNCSEMTEFPVPSNYSYCHW